MELKRSAALLALLAASACATARPLPCVAPATRQVSETLYFGTQRPGGAVSALDWQGFLAAEVTPRFPDGFTSWSASGQWRGASGIVREDSYVFAVEHPDTPEGDAAIRAIMEAYKKQFQQEAVLRVRSASCVSF